MTLNAAMFSSDRPDWQTPPEVLDLVREVFGGQIDCDPCTAPDNPTRARTFYTEADDGLVQPWHGDTYVNPPYGRGIGAWTERAISQHLGDTCRSVLLLLPARTDTRWCWELVTRADAVCFWRGRLTFVGAPSTAPFPSMLVYAGPDSYRFRYVFREHGWAVEL